MKTYKIAIVANACWNIYNFRMELISHLAEMGHKVFVLAPDDGYFMKLQFPAGVQFQKLNNLDPKGRNPIRELFCFLELFTTFRNLQPDIVLNYTIKPNLYGSIAARWLGIKAISNLTGLGFTARKSGLFRNGILKVYKWAIYSNCEIVFHNHEDLNWFRARKLISATRGTVIAGSGVNADSFKPIDGIKPYTPFVFIFVGRICREKGIVEFLSAGKLLAAKYPHIKCWVVGSMEHLPDDDNTPAILNAYKNNTSFAFFGFEDDVRKRLKDAHVFVLPSYREGRSKAMLEAMAMELPVITTEVAGCQETVVQDVHGFIVPPQNVEALVEAMESIMKVSVEELAAMGKRCRVRVLELFESKHILSAYDDIIEKAMRKMN